MPGYAKRSYKRRTYYRRRATFSRPKRRAVPIKYKKSLKTIVHKAISHRSENKWAVMINPPTDIPVYIGNNQIANVVPILPRIPQGTSADNRIGRKIQPKYFIVKGFVSMDMSQTDADDYDRLGVWVVVCQPRKFGLVSDALSDITNNPGANWTTSMMTDGSLTAPWAGLRTDWNLNLNPGAMKFYVQRKFFLTRPRMMSNAGERYAGNSVKYFKMRVPVPKGLNFSTPLDTTPRGYAPLLCCGAVLLNGAAPVPPPAAPVTAMTLSAVSTLYYEDS